jgi:hypothetical protein
MIVTHTSGKLTDYLFKLIVRLNHSMHEGLDVFLYSSFKEIIQFIGRDFSILLELFQVTSVLDDDRIGERSVTEEERSIIMRLAYKRLKKNWNWKYMSMVKELSLSKDAVKRWICVCMSLQSCNLELSERIRSSCGRNELDCMLSELLPKNVSI